MAEAMPERSNWTSKVLCRYFLHGVCRAGSQCPYSHDLSQGEQSMVCRYYLKGCCTYGDKCRYDHTRPRQVNHNTAKKSNIRPAKPLLEDIGSKSSPITKASSNSNNSKSLAKGPKPIMLSDLASSSLTSTSTMVTLKKQSAQASTDSGLGDDSLVSSPPPSDWVKAAEFVPGQTWKSASLPSSYSAAAQTGVEGESAPEMPEMPATLPSSKDELCPFAAHGECQYGEGQCAYVHGDVCDLCDKSVLHPTDSTLREKHMQECMRQHEENMELSFAIQRSRGKSCGICMEVVWEKNPPAQRKFGILSSCCHVFCLECIRKWRSAKQFENKIVRACPECRVKSDFVTPSKYWVENQTEKDKLIQGYKKALSVKPCRYFDQGRGECPFNENCFYLHAYPDGRKASPKPVRRRRRQDASGDLDIMHQLILWDFLEERHNAIAHILRDNDDLTDFFFQLNLLDWSLDSDDSDLSDFEGYS